MKNLVFVLIALFAFNAQAQREHSRHKSDMTPEQMAIMRTKQMTLALDLNIEQQDKILAMNKANAEQYSKMKEKKGERKELTNDEKFELKNKMLDNQIANQRAMKEVLNEGQFSKWKKMQKARMGKMKKGKSMQKMHMNKKRPHMKKEEGK